LSFGASSEQDRRSSDHHGIWFFGLQSQQFLLPEPFEVLTRLHLPNGNSLVYPTCESASALPLISQSTFCPSSYSRTYYNPPKNRICICRSLAFVTLDLHHHCTEPTTLHLPRVV
jgi:hypothetical protein